MALSKMSTHTTIYQLLTLALLSTATATYALADDYSGHNFFSGFNFFSDTDPTTGYVAYQPEAAAISQSLVGYLTDDQIPGGAPNTSSIFLGVDYTTTPADDASGRASVRLEGKKGYDTGLLIADILHMPAAVDGSWPALWLLGMDTTWPEDGEIDILEGVNSVDHNSVTLHTAPGCTIASEATPAPPSNDTCNSGGGGGIDGAMSFTGTVVTSNCDINAPDQSPNKGCSIEMASATSPTDPLANYGDAFNAAGGGVYAVEWTSTGITAWFFPRSQASTFPPSLLSSTPNPAEFGVPVAKFSGGECDFTARFKQLRIIINTTFCGQWAGAVWEEEGCAERTGMETCEEFVKSKPEAFEKVYWEFRGLKVFQQREEGAASRVRRGGVRSAGRGKGGEDGYMEYLRGRGPRKLIRPGQKRGVRLSA